ncbi:MAG: hypothetical protein JWO08_4410 [Verrucomicrobiaceae bacterium]|nr:hypothetical protein [Verrucomicrobiaceae bacterium]
MKSPVLITLTVLLARVSLSAAVPTTVKFSREVLPILVENCFACHGFDKAKRKAGLRLDQRDAALAEHDGVHAIVPGNPEQSELWARLTSTDAEKIMPPPKTGKHLTDAQREIVKRWIAEGAKYEPHWSFIAPDHPAPPAATNVTHPIDKFVQVKLAEEGLKPSPAAARTTQIRRLCLDLTGLPPTPGQVAAFVKDENPDAYERLVDRLLESEHYGERWGRWWLDQARYADSNGYSIDAPRQIWKYRDWVVSALNADMPFDEFTVEQLAGDLLPKATEAQKIATGFHRNTQINQEGGIDKEQFRIDSVFDRVATTSTVWLGLTIGCAQCHDHKFDPVEQKEYYRLFAFLNNQDEPTLTIALPKGKAAAVTSAWKKTAEQIQSIIDANAEDFAKWEADLTPSSRKRLSKPILKALDTAKEKRTLDQNRLLYVTGTGAGVSEFMALNDRYTLLDEQLKKGDTTLVIAELPKPRKTTVFVKGDFTRPADEVTPGTPSVLPPLKTSNPSPNRLDLAHWISSRDNPLTARVLVNRLWMQYFGVGLVETDNDFGLVGSPPSHPELLNWLATEFMARGWSLKAMHRLIVTSATYRQASSDRADLREKDANNRLLGRQRRLRLDAEIVRDVALSASGLLSPKLGGPPVFPPIPEGVTSQGQVKRPWIMSSGEDKFRRGLYTFRFRGTPPPSLNVFDSPEGNSTCTRRNRSNTPLQALTLMNDAACFEFAVALEKLIQKQGIETAFRRCTGRGPDAAELAILQRLSRINAARALLNLDETITRE